jgi:hypothetical protein
VDPVEWKHGNTNNSSILRRPGEKCNVNYVPEIIKIIENVLMNAHVSDYN